MKPKRKDFERIRALRQELETLNARIKRTPARETIGDTYGDYRSGHKVIRVVQGESTARHTTLIEKYKVKAAALAQIIADIEDAMDDVEDPVIRDIFRLYYQDGLSEQAVADIKGYSRPRISQLINDYWKQEKD